MIATTATEAAMYDKKLDGLLRAVRWYIRLKKIYRFPCS